MSGEPPRKKRAVGTTNATWNEECDALHEHALKELRPDSYTAVIIKQMHNASYGFARDTDVRTHFSGEFTRLTADAGGEPHALIWTLKRVPKDFLKSTGDDIETKKEDGLKEDGQKQDGQKHDDQQQKNEQK